jgi:hypothetical protein
VTDGFNWGLRPRGEEPADDSAETDLPTQAIEQHELPTQAIEQTDLPTQAIEQHELPTQAIDHADLPTRAYQPPPALRPAPTEALAWSNLADEPRPHDPTSAIDSLFGDTQFQEYEEIGLLQAVLPPGVEPAPGAPDQPRGSRAPLTSTQKAMLWSGAGLVAVLAIVALFLLGVRAGSASATPVAAHTKTPHSAGTTSVPVTAGVPVAPGIHAWNALQGGECIQPFTSVWAASFTTVDCGSPHAGQLLLKGTLPDAAGSTYPSATSLQAEVTPLCSATTVLNYAAAAAVTDAQIGFSYPATKADWSKGDRTFYCFISRTSGDALPGNLAVTPAG